MRALCPHCAKLNEFARPPTTAIIYCQHCRKPFGAGALQPSPGSNPPQRTRPSQLSSPSPRARRRPVSSPAVAPQRPNEVGFGQESTERFATRRSGSGPVAAQVIVPKGRSEGKAGPVAKIVYISPDGLETDFLLEDASTIGRHPKNNIRLNDREISKEHAVLERRGSDWWLRDLNSSNGSYVNSRRVKESKLTNGDELLLGSMRLLFKIELSGGGAGEAGESAKDLVTILPQDPSNSTHIHTKLEEEEEADFLPVEQVSDPETLKRDYEKLRMSHELARIGLTTNISELLEKTMEVVFSMFPADNAVVMLVDEDTNTLVPHTVKQRGKKQEILLSSTIVNSSLTERASMLASDAVLDPRFSGSQSIIAQGIRAAMCVPMIAQDKVLGILHLDSRERVGAFTEKDLQILKVVATQTAVSIQNARLVRQIEEEAKTRGQLQRFLPPHVVEEMVGGKGRVIQKGGQELEASVVFCDIRGFTSLSESSSAQEVVDLLNDYFERLVDVVFRRHGVLDKFIGDALMASWGTIGDEDVATSTFNCVAAAIEFRDEIRLLNEERAAAGQSPIMMGVGVNTGALVAGYMGSRRRLEFTVIGDTVNTASRVCGIAEGDQVIISDTTYRHVAERIEARYLGSRQVKGKEQEIGVYEALRIKDDASSGSRG